jgi:hypothetical protein
MRKASNPRALHTLIVVFYKAVEIQHVKDLESFMLMLKPEASGFSAVKASRTHTFCALITIVNQSHTQRAIFIVRKTATGGCNELNMLKPLAMGVWMYAMTGIAKSKVAEKALKVELSIRNS